MWPGCRKAPTRCTCTSNTTERPGPISRTSPTTRHHARRLPSSSWRRTSARGCSWAGRATSTPRKDSGCGPLLWTHRRYSPEVVASMVAALRSFLSMHPFRRVVLIGYSGGGTIAWLMAASRAGNDSCRHRRSQPRHRRLGEDPWLQRARGLFESCVAAGASANDHSVALRRQPRPERAALDRAVLRPHHPGARVIEVADFEHECCWIERWPCCSTNRRRRPSRRVARWTEWHPETHVRANPKKGTRRGLLSNASGRSPCQRAYNAGDERARLPLDRTDDRNQTND